MTHEELLVKLQEEYALPFGVKTFAALRAVVELHKPEEVELKHDWWKLKCSHLYCQEEYPCPTIQAIEKELK